MHIFSGVYKSRKIQAPKGEKTRPSSGRLREAFFNICQGKIEGASFLDLFAGSGAMGLEALSRGARQATFVDNSRESIRCIQANLFALELAKSGEVLYADVFETMRKLAKKGRGFEIIYADPPYETFVHHGTEKLSLSAHVVGVIDELIESGQSLLQPDGVLFIEDASSDSIAMPQKIKHLSLYDSRNMGKTTLQQWRLLM
jgi:16S rRNA (guanine966-N2)-methyltransferase